MSDYALLAGFIAVALASFGLVGYISLVVAKFVAFMLWGGGS